VRRALRPHPAARSPTLNPCSEGLVGREYPAESSVRHRSTMPRRIPRPAPAFQAGVTRARMLFSFHRPTGLCARPMSCARIGCKNGRSRASLLRDPPYRRRAPDRGPAARSWRASIPPTVGPACRLAHPRSLSSHRGPSPPSHLLSSRNRLYRLALAWLDRRKALATPRPVTGRGDYLTGNYLADEIGVNRDPRLVRRASRRPIRIWAGCA